MELSVRIISVPTAPDIWHMRPDERLARQLSQLGITLHQKQNTTHLVILRGDVVYEDAVLKALIEKPDTALVTDNHTPLAVYTDIADADSAQAWLFGDNKPEKLNLITPEKLGLSYNEKLRKRAETKSYILTPDTVRSVEWELYKASYKGVTDLVTKYVWPVPAFHITRLCARYKLSPNFVTAIGAAFMFFAFGFFCNGQYGLGLIAAWIMTFLDTVDGKLARVTLTSSKWGNIFDHGIDLIHPPFWYLAWGIGLSKTGFDAPWIAFGIGAIFTTYIIARLCEGYFIRRFGFHIHVWRKIDSFFRLIVARRNPNLIILTLFWIFGRPDIGLLLVVIWTVAAVPVHLLQIYQAELQRKARPLTSWLNA